MKSAPVIVTLHHPFSSFVTNLYLTFFFHLSPFSVSLFSPPSHQFSLSLFFLAFSFSHFHIRGLVWAQPDGGTGQVHPPCWLKTSLTWSNSSNGAVKVLIGNTALFETNQTAECEPHATRRTETLHKMLHHKLLKICYWL